ncbi:MAG: hypothetical protein L3J36_02360 [Rhodobacteraceae bacterium]|nr:hypothetical protein [Paracoccaceae bacterium]
MPLYILLLLVIGGISMIALLLHRLGKSRLTVLSTPSASHAWNRHFPDDEVYSVILAENGHAAYVETSGGPGLLWSFGADTVGRHLQDYRLSQAPDHLKVVFHDFTAPQVILRLNDKERPRWQQKLAPR